MNGVQASVGEGDVCFLNRNEVGVGRNDLLFLSTVKRCRTLCGPFHGDSSGEIPIIYGYFVPNPEKYWPVKGYRTYHALLPYVKFIYWIACFIYL